MTTIEPSSIKIWIKNKDIYTWIKFWEWGVQPDNKSVLDASASFRLSGDVQLGGKARFSLQPLDDLMDWQVGFIQVIRDYGVKVRYTGRVSEEGSIVCTAKGFPPLLDCRPNATIPWYNNTPAALFKGGPGSGNSVNINTEDYPNYGVPVTLQNKKKAAGVYNYLYDFTAVMEFWTILAVMSPARVRQYLGYCHWRVRNNASFIWRSGKPQASTDWGSFTRLDQDKGEFAPGAPPEIELQSILANPVGPLSNDVMRPQLVFAITGGGGEFWMHQDFDEGLSPIVRNFWG